MEMKIMQPITVGGITLKNRIMFPPLTTGYEERTAALGNRAARSIPVWHRAVWDTSCWATLRHSQFFSHAKAV